MRVLEYAIFSELWPIIVGVIVSQLTRFINKTVQFTNLLVNIKTDFPGYSIQYDTNNKNRVTFYRTKANFGHFLCYRSLVWCTHKTTTKNQQNYKSDIVIPQAGH